MRKSALAVLVSLAVVSSAGEKPPVRWEPVPHFGHGSSGRRIDLVVIHTVEGSAASCLATFRGSERIVSAHYLVAKDGTLFQCVKDEDVAWHAGSVNGHSIGIEHEGFARRRDTWTDANYAASARLTRWLCDTYAVPIDRKHIVGHVELPGSTHDDPGPYFDWDRYMRLVRGDAAPIASDAAAGSDDGLPPPALPASSSPTGGGGSASPQQSVAPATSGSQASRSQASGPPSTGITGALDRGAKPKHPLLARGATGETVRDLQRRLDAAAGACTLAEDGTFGPETEKAVRAFQEKNGCKVDGIVGPETWGALDPPRPTPP